MKAAADNLESLKVPALVKELTRVLKINERVCGAVGPAFAKQMGRIFLEMMNLYKAFSSFVSNAYVPPVCACLCVCVCVCVCVWSCSRGVCTASGRTARR